MAYSTDTTGTAAGLTPSTTTSIGVGSIELGHASDTTITRTSAGIIAVEGVELATQYDAPISDALTVGEATIHRRFVNTTAVSGSGTMRLTYFTAQKSETITKVRTFNSTGGNASGATLCRIGIYSVNASNGELTLVASTANDTTLWASTTASAYTKSLSASFSKVRGQRYAVGQLCIATTSFSTFGSLGQLPTTEYGQSPRFSAGLSGNTDLPSTISAASMFDTGITHYVVLLP